jgi:hypothetical protein
MQAMDASTPYLAKALSYAHQILIIKYDLTGSNHF